MSFKSGFVAIIGKSNVGKSSLVNRLVGEKVSIVSPKTQTTRNRIFGIKNSENYQIVFVDTPGVQHTKTKLGEYMSKVTETSATDVDAIVVVMDATKINTEDHKILERFKSVQCPVFVVINKIDLASFEKLYPKLAKLNEYGFVKKFITTSALKNKNIEELETALVECLPEGVPYYPTDQYTDKSTRFMCEEIIRQKALLYLSEEIPHGIAVEITKFDESGEVTQVDANLITENQRHKQIIIGAGGGMLKKIGSAARTEMEELVGRKVMLEIFVKVRKDWKDDASILNELGFNKKDIN